MKVKTQLAELRAKYGNLSYEEIAAYTEIDRQQLSALENNQASSIEFVTLAKLCSFFKCTPNDLLILEGEGEENAPPTPDEIATADGIIKQAFARAEAIPTRSAEEIWDSFEANIDRISSQLSNSESILKTDPKRMKVDA